jgi:glutathione S-transferase
MQLIGMLDSPYVRRVAISMKLMGLPFEHRSVSVFRHYPEFERINPLVKAPTLVCDDGQILMDSSLILDYLEGLVPADQRLLPTGGVARRDALQRIGIALTACEKTAQHYYEMTLRPAEKREATWLARVDGQLVKAFQMLEPLAAKSDTLGISPVRQDGLTMAVAWRFTQFNSPGLIDPAGFPALVAFSAAAETLPAFLSTPLD